MSTNVKIVLGALAALVALLTGAYWFGYSRASTEGLLALEELKRANAEAVVKAQEKVRGEYEETIKALSLDLASANDLNRKRLRELDAFRSADGDLAACRRERGDLAELAVEGEQLLREADGYLKALTK